MIAAYSRKHSGEFVSYCCCLLCAFYSSTIAWTHTPSTKSVPSTPLSFYILIQIEFIADNDFGPVCFS